MRMSTHRDRLMKTLYDDSDDLPLPITPPARSKGKRFFEKMKARQIQLTSDSDNNSDNDSISNSDNPKSLYTKPIKKKKKTPDAKIRRKKRLDKESKPRLIRTREPSIEDITVNMENDVIIMEDLIQDFKKQISLLNSTTTIQPSPMDRRKKRKVKRDEIYISVFSTYLKNFGSGNWYNTQMYGKDNINIRVNDNKALYVKFDENGKCSKYLLDGEMDPKQTRTQNLRKRSKEFTKGRVLKFKDKVIPDTVDMERTLWRMVTGEEEEECCTECGVTLD